MKGSSCGHRHCAPNVGFERQRRNLVLVTGATLFVYALLAVFFHALADQAQRHLMESVAWPAVILLALFYWLGYRAVAQSEGDRVTFWMMLVGAILLAGMCLFIPPFHSDDLYSYVSRGWLQYHYGLDPYVHTVGEVPGWQSDPMLTRRWIWNPCPYGFLFARLTWLVCRLGQGNLAQTLLYLKLMNLCAWTCTAALLYLTAAKLGLRRPDLTLYLYAWNPLVLLHGLANGHNDMLVAVFVVLAVYLIAIEAWVIAAVALTAAVLVKSPAAIVLAFALVLTLRRKGLWTAVLAGTAVMTTIGVAGSAYLVDLREFKLHLMLKDLVFTCNSLELTIVTWLQWLAPDLAHSLHLVHSLTASCIWVAVLTVVAMVFVRFARQPATSLQSFIAAALSAEILVICVGSSKFNPWYVIMFFPLALLLEEGDWLRSLGIALSLTELLHFTTLQHAKGISYMVTTGIPIVIAVWFERKRERREALTAQGFAWFRWLTAAAVVRVAASTSET